MKVRDADGMTFLMHAANPASSSKKKKRPKHQMLQQGNDDGGGGGQTAPFVTRATTTGQLGRHTASSGGGTMRLDCCSVDLGGTYQEIKGGASPRWRDGTLVGIGVPLQQC